MADRECLLCGLYRHRHRHRHVEDGSAVGLRVAVDHHPSAQPSSLSSRHDAMPCYAMPCHAMPGQSASSSLPAPITAPPRYVGRQSRNRNRSHSDASGRIPVPLRSGECPAPWTKPPGQPRSIHIHIHIHIHNDDHPTASTLKPSTLTLPTSPPTGADTRSNWWWRGGLARRWGWGWGWGWGCRRKGIFIPPRGASNPPLAAPSVPNGPCRVRRERCYSYFLYSVS